MSEVVPPNEEQRALEEGRRVLAPPPLDAAGPGTLAWHAMPATARATACLVALLHRRPLVRDEMRYDPARGVVFVTHPDQTRAGGFRVAARAVAGTVEDVLGAIRAQFGHRAGEVERMVKSR